MLVRIPDMELNELGRRLELPPEWIEMEGRDFAADIYESGEIAELFESESEQYAGLPQATMVSVVQKALETSHLSNDNRLVIRSAIKARESELRTVLEAA